MISVLPSKSFFPNFLGGCWLPIRPYRHVFFRLMQPMHAVPTAMHSNLCSNQHQCPQSPFRLEPTCQNNTCKWGFLHEGRPKSNDLSSLLLPSLLYFLSFLTCLDPCSCSLIEYADSFWMGVASQIVSQDWKWEKIEGKAEDLLARSCDERMWNP